MPRLRVEPSTTEVELRAAIVNLFAASHVIDEKLANPRLYDRHPEWIVERRPCPMCCVKACGCPSEPELLLVEAHIIRGEE